MFEGLTREEIQQRHPIEFEKWRADPLAPSYTYPEGENRAGFAERVERGLATTLKLIEASRRAESERALIVAHRGVIRTIVRALIGAEPAVDLGSIQILAAKVSLVKSWRATPNGIRWCSTSPRIWTESVSICARTLVRGNRCVTGTCAER